MRNKHLVSWRRTLAAMAASTIVSAGFVAPSLASDDGDAATTTPIKHVVVIFQENITFDHYFATYPNAQNNQGETLFTVRDETPSVNGLSAALLNNNPNKFNPFRLSPAQAVTCDQDHGYTDEQKSVDGGLLDLFVQATGRTGLGCNPDGQTVMGYYDGNTVTALWNYAQRFAMNDSAFGTTFGPSTPGALNLISGQTHGATVFKTTAPGAATPNNVTSGSVFFAAGDAQGTVISDPDPFADDCGADQGVTKVGVSTVQMNGPNIGDLLNKNGITWRWFQGGFRPTRAAFTDGTGFHPALCGSQTSAARPAHPTAANPTDGNPTNFDVHTEVIFDYSAHHAPFMYYASTRNPHHLPPTSVAMIGHTDQANHQYDLSDFVAALQGGNLPAVSYLKAPSFQDGHPGNSDPLSEQTFVVNVLNMLQQSPEWRETAVILTYDDSDGWYDHVTGPIVSPSSAAVDSFVPLPGNNHAATSPSQIATSGNCGVPAQGAFQARCGYGPRIPFLVLSPFAKQNFVDHTTIDQSSVLAFIEKNWSLGFIDGSFVSGQSSLDRLAGDIGNMFDFDDKPSMGRLVLDPITGAKLDD